MRPSIGHSNDGLDLENNAVDAVIAESVDVSRSSSLSSFDLSSLTLTEHESSGVGGRQIWAKQEAFQRARDLALSLTSTLGDDKAELERKARVRDFFLLSFTASFILFSPLAVVSEATQAAAFQNSSLSTAMKSDKWLFSMYFLIGACAATTFESISSVILFYIYERMMRSGAGQGELMPHKKFGIHNHNIWSVVLITVVLLLTVMVPYLIMLSYIQNGSVSLLEPKYVALSFWQYQVLETLAVCYLKMRQSNGLPRDIEGLNSALLNLDRSLSMAWVLNLAARCCEVYSNIADYSLVNAATVMHILSIAFYVVYIGMYSWMFFPRWVSISYKVKYNFLACLVVALFVLFYMGTKYFLLFRTESLKLADLGEQGLCSRTFILSILVIPISVLLPARFMFLDHILVRTTVKKISDGLVGDEEKSDDREV